MVKRNTKHRMRFNDKRPSFRSYNSYNRQSPEARTMIMMVLMENIIDTNIMNIDF